MIAYGIVSMVRIDLKAMFLGHGKISCCELVVANELTLDFVGTYL